MQLLASGPSSDVFTLADGQTVVAFAPPLAVSAAGVVYLDESELWSRATAGNVTIASIRSSSGECNCPANALWFLQNALWFLYDTLWFLHNALPVVRVEHHCLLHAAVSCLFCPFVRPSFHLSICLSRHGCRLICMLRLEGATMGSTGSPYMLTNDLFGVMSVSLLGVKYIFFAIHHAHLISAGTSTLGSAQAASLQVLGTSTLGGTQAASLQVLGSSTLGGSAADTVVVKAEAEFDLDVLVDASLSVLGDIILGDNSNQTLSVYAVTTFESTASPITSNAAIIANAAVTANAAFTANGPVIAHAAVTVAGPLSAQGSTVLGSASGASDTLTVNAVTTFAASSSPITANAQVVATAGMTVAGAFATSGNHMCFLLLPFVAHCS